MSDVGARLREVRSQRGLSQRALAARSNVPSSTVSLIESGRTSPSVGSLKRLLDGVGVTLAEFFSFELPDRETFFFRQADLIEVGRGGVSYRQVGQFGAAQRLQILDETYEPGADSGRVLLTHDGEEGGLIITGRLEVTLGERKAVLNAGDAYLFPSLKPHRFRNRWPDPCRVISVCTPPSF